MKSVLKFTRLTLFMASLSMVLIACGLIRPSQIELPGGQAGTPLGDSPGAANGEMIYFTATSSSGERISYRGGPPFGGMMMGSYLTCSACHGLTARGGWHFMHMDVMRAPDIRIVALSSESDEHDEGHGEYNVETFRHAVVDGQHPDGEALNQDMPRWQMSDDDLADLFAFLQSLP